LPQNRSTTSPTWLTDHATPLAEDREGRHSYDRGRGTTRLGRWNCHRFSFRSSRPDDNPGRFSADRRHREGKTEQQPPAVRRMKWAKRTTSARDKASVPAGVVPPMHPRSSTRYRKAQTGFMRSNGTATGSASISRPARFGFTRNLHGWTNRIPSIVEAVSGLRP
jgi:hypothetical protein